MTVPSKLRFVPNDFTDDSGEPLICSSRTILTYLSRRYSSKDIASLVAIGVQYLSAADFLADLKLFISNDPECYHNKPNLWHSRLASTLLLILYGEEAEKFKSSIFELEIVPLRDGRWVSPSHQGICLPNLMGSSPAPNGIKVHEIQSKAVEDYERRELFRLLGAASSTNELLCNAIIQTHEDPAFNPEDLPNEDLMGHVLFLYSANWKNTGNHNLWLVTELGSACRSSQIYLDSDEPQSATTLFARDRKRFLFLHKLYFRVHSEVDLDWTAWLVKNLHVAKYPRLVVYDASSDAKLSKDFQFLLDTRSSQEILMMFRDQWSHYSMHFGSIEATAKAPKSDLTEKLSRMHVCCHGGETARLSQTILPVRDITYESIASMSFLDVPEPDDPRWKYLEHFGVVVESGAEPFIQCLLQLKGSKAPSVEQVSELYKQIQEHSLYHGEKIRYEFCIFFSDLTDFFITGMLLEQTNWSIFPFQIREVRKNGLGRT